MLKLNQLSSVDNFWNICYIDVCLTGICYKDLAEENAGTEIPNWSINTSCSSLINDIDKEFKVEKIIGKEINPYHKVIGKYYVK